jgi:hypothetical protein
MAIYRKWLHNHKPDAHNVLMRINMHNSQIMHCDTFGCHLILLEFIHIDSNNKVIQIEVTVLGWRYVDSMQKTLDRVRVIGTRMRKWKVDPSVCKLEVDMNILLQYRKKASVELRTEMKRTSLQKKFQKKAHKMQNRHIDKSSSNSSSMVISL